MKEEVPQTDWPLYDPALMQAIGVRILQPKGDIESRGGRLVIGGLRITARGLTVIPRCGLTPKQMRRLLSKVDRVWARGPRDHHWKLVPDLGWCAEVYTRQESGFTSASARKIRSVSSDGVPTSSSSSSLGVRRAPLPVFFGWAS